MTITRVGTRAVFLASAAAYTTLAVVLTYPLVQNLSTTLPHDLGDPLLSASILWWHAHVVPLSSTWWNGFLFWPAHGTTALSDHRLGQSLIATPLQWTGLNAIAAYNLTWLATFPLSALAAQWLGWTIVRRHDAAIVCGLAYGFCPYRVAHLEHIELLSGFGTPIALAALHRYRDTERPRWLALFAGALVVQGLFCSYYLLFFFVLLPFWMAWFVGWRAPRRLGAIAAASGAAAVVLLPIFIGFQRIHAWYDLHRDFEEITQLSADVTAFAAASPLSAVWGWTSTWARKEGALFPGLTITALAATAVVLAWRRSAPHRDRVDRWLAQAPAVAGGFAFVAVCGWTFAPWHLGIGPLRVSSDAPFKPFSLAVLVVAISIAASSRLRAAARRRSTFAFYAIAAVLLFACALGPKPAVAGRQFLYEPIYAWLMELPLFGSIRVPARFAMPAMLTLAVTGALALDRLARTERSRRALAVLCVAGIVADGWIVGLPLPPLPDVWPPARAAGFAAVLELPMGDVFDEDAAVYRATMHGRPVMNGNAAFMPPHYATLKAALDEHDPATLDGLPAGAPVLIVVDRRKDADRRWERFVRDMPRVRPIASDERWAFFSAAPPATTPPCTGEPASIASATDDSGPVDVRALTDRNAATFWTTSHAQHAGDALTLDLGSDVRPCAVTVSIGQFRNGYPRTLLVDTSRTGADWTTVAEIRTAGLALRGVLKDPMHAPIAIGLAPSTGRFMRLRLGESHADAGWIVSDIAVTAATERE